MSETSRPITAAILTLGCELTIADSEIMARSLRCTGWNLAGRTEADAVIVIAGFPEEGEPGFEECYEFCEEMRFAGIHVFPYSRMGTGASRLPGYQADAVEKQRVHRRIEPANRPTAVRIAGLSDDGVIGEVMA